MSRAVVGVVGGSGAVGRSALKQLRAWGIGPMVAGARDARRLRAILDAAGLGDVDASAVDVLDAASLARFCAGCSVVLNCAGPAVVIGDRVARAAAEAGTSYVDAAGDDALYGGLSGWGGGTVAVISAGMMPGITGLLPRCFGERARGGLLTGYVGGRDRFTATAAHDYLAVEGSYGEPLALWRDGRRVSRSLSPVVDLSLPHFPEPVLAQPYLSTETERLARRMGLSEVRWYSVFAGGQVAAALRQGSVADRVDRLCRAAELDTFGRESYQRILLELTPVADVDPAASAGRSTIVLHGRGASALTGAFAALTTGAVHAGQVPAGVHHAAEVLDPAAAMARLRTADAIVELAELIDDVMHEGAL